MPTLQTGSGALRINVPRGSTLIIRNQSGVETVTGSSAAREDATFALGANAVVYGPQSASSDVSITTTGVLTYDIVSGDATPATDDVRVSRNAATGAPSGLVDATGQPVGGGGVGRLSSRRPTPADNGSLGYSTSSLWTTDNGDTYQPSVITQTDAVWNLVERKAAITAGLTGLQGVWGLFKEIPEYTGPACDITVTIGGTPTTATIPFDGRWADERAIQALAARADAGTYIRCYTVYDQTGQGRDLVKGTLDGHYVQWDAELGRYAFTSDPQGKNYLSMPATVATTVHGFTVVTLGSGNSTNSGSFPCAWTLGTNATASFAYQGFNPSPRLGGRGSITGGVTAPAAGQPVPFQYGPMVSIVASGPSNATFVANEFSSTNNQSTINANLPGGFTGGDGSTNGFHSAVNWVLMVVTNTQATAAQIAQVKQSAYNVLRVVPQVRDTIIMLTDSRGAYSNTDRLQNVGRFLSASLSGYARVIGVEQGSTTAQLQIAQGIPAMGAAFRRPGGKLIGCVLLGINSFGNNGESVETALNNLQAFYAHMRGLGYTHILAVAELATTWGATPNGGVNGLPSQNVPLLRARMIELGASGLGVDVVVDVSGSVAVTSPSNGAYYPDGIHPRSIVHRIVADGLAPAVKTILGIA